MITIPILLIPAGIIVYMFYEDMEDDSTLRTEQEISLASQLACESMKGYDFSGFDRMDDHTGTASIELTEKLQGFDNGKYVYWVVSISESGKNAVLARSDRVSVPIR